MNRKFLIIGVVVLLVVAGAAGGGFFWWKNQQAPQPVKHSSEPDLDAKEFRYLGLDKIIVMLKDNSGKGEHRYVALDLVFRTDKKHEENVKADLPMLRSVVVRTMSHYSPDQVMQKDIEAVTAAINRDLAQAYESTTTARPFSQAMIAKMLIE